MRISFGSTVLAISLGLVACGDGDGGSKGKASGGQSYAAILDAVNKPSGTVSADTAPEIASEYEKITGAGAKQKQAQNHSQSCTNGGTISIVAEGNQSAAKSVIDYDNCCEGACCLDGGGTWYFSNEQGSDYLYCGNYNIAISCDSADSDTTMQYEGCVGTNGSWTYAVRVNGESFAVTGSYYDGNGTLEVTGANGSYSCTYTNYTGSCTGSNGSFEF